MIQLLTGFAAKQLLQREAEHPQLAKIQALLKAYGTEYDFCRFYRQNLDENDTAYMCKLDDSGVLWVGAHSNIQDCRRYLLPVKTDSSCKTMILPILVKAETFL